MTAREGKEAEREQTVRILDLAREKERKTLYFFQHLETNYSPKYEHGATKLPAVYKNSSEKSWTASEAHSHFNSDSGQMFESFVLNKELDSSLITDEEAFDRESPLGPLGTRKAYWEKEWTSNPIPPRNYAVISEEYKVHSDDENLKGCKLFVFLKVQMRNPTRQCRASYLRTSGNMYELKLAEQNLADQSDVWKNVFVVPEITASQSDETIKKCAGLASALRKKLEGSSSSGSSGDGLIGKGREVMDTVKGRFTGFNPLSRFQQSSRQIQLTAVSMALNTKAMLPRDVYVDAVDTDEIFEAGNVGGSMRSRS